MSKLLIILLLGFVVYKIGKNVVYVALENLFKTKTLKPPEELVKCVQCEKYISQELVIKHKKNNFCSQDCVDDFNQQNT